jgi:predicted DNA binding CopG/RHH family protein
MEKRKKMPIPDEFTTLEEAGEFWDTESAADHWDQMDDVAMEVDIRERRFSVLLEDAVYYAVEELAATKGVQLDTFLNEFLRKELVHSPEM